MGPSARPFVRPSAPRRRTTDTALRAATAAAVERLEDRRLLSAELIADINPTGSSVQRGTTPSSSAVLGNVMLFAASNGQSGAGLELWRTDGTAAGTRLVKDIYPGNASTGAVNFSNPGWFVAGDGVAYFAATTGTDGRELWRSDGTEAGTWQVANLEATPGPGPSGLLYHDGAVYFTQRSSTGRNALWRSDGTAAGTALVKDVNVLTGGSGTVGAPSAAGGSSLVASGDTMYFAGNDGASGTELWKSDGTTASTTVVRDALPGTAGAAPSMITSAGNGVVYYYANGGATTGTELWRSDGTEAGTYRVKDIEPGSTSTVRPPALAVMDGAAYFPNNEGGQGWELWRAGGAPDSAAIVKDLFAGAGGSDPALFEVVGGRLFFVAADATSGRELFVTDGTAAGTQLVANVGPGGDPSTPTPLAGIGNTLFFSAWAPEFGQELWQTDGTPGNTSIVRDIFPGATAGDPFAIGVLPLADGTERFVFGAHDGAHAFEPWSADVPPPPPANNAPVARIRGPLVPLAEGRTRPVTLVDDGSIDPDGDAIVNYEWDFNYDGTTFDANATGTQATFFGLDGPQGRVVALRVTDARGATGFATFTVQAINAAPSAVPQVNLASTEGVEKTFTFNAADPGDDMVRSWVIDWGDGSPFFTATVPPEAPTRLVTTTHTYADSGQYPMRVWIEDEDGTFETRHTINVANVAPTLALAGPDAVDEGSPYTLDFSATDPGADAISKWVVDWGDGTVNEFDSAATGATHTWADDAADGGPFVVTVTATDEDGSYAATKSVNVANVAPSVAIDGDDRSAAEGETLTFDGSYADAGTGDTHELTWGVYAGDVRVASGTGTTFTHEFADDGTYVVWFDVADDDGAAASDAVTVGVSNRAPTATLAADGPVGEGSPATVQFTDVADGPADLAAGLRYSFDFNGDGDFTDPGDVLDAESAAASFAFADDGTYTVRGRVTDKDGRWSEYATTVTVTNVPPTVQVVAPAEGRKNREITFAFNVTDPSSVDAASSYLFWIDWDGSGNVDQLVWGRSGLEVTHEFRRAGTYTVRVFATDKDGGRGPVTELTITIR